MTNRILFVCLGNICRSPSAEGVVRAMAQAQGIDVTLDSAGTSDWHVGGPPYGPMQQAAKARGYDLSNLRARQVTVADFNRFDLIIAMDDENLHNLQAMRHSAGDAGGPRATIRKFTDFAPETGADHVPDPYYTRDFDGTLTLIERAAQGLLGQLGE